MDNLDAPMLSQKQVDDAANYFRNKTFNVLDDGHVVLVDVMGGDAAICDAARVCYGAGIVKRSKDVPLIRYLMRHRHTTPFEMVEFKFRIRIPMDAWRQYIRHRTASVNEYSTRYSEAISEKQKTPSDQWRAQSVSNNQGSGEFIADDNDLPDYGKLWLVSEGARAKAADEEPRTVGEHLSWQEENLHQHVDKVYNERLKFGVAKEQARKDLTLSNYTEAYWKIDLHNLLHFLSLRMDSHAQKEIREYAWVIGEEIVSKLVPVTWQAFLDYRFDAINLTRLDSEVIKAISLGGNLLPIQKEEFMAYQHDSWVDFEKCRERDECIEKLVRLGMVV